MEKVDKFDQLEALKVIRDLKNEEISLTIESLNVRIKGFILVNYSEIFNKETHVRVDVREWGSIIIEIKDIYNNRKTLDFTRRIDFINSVKTITYELSYSTSTISNDTPLMFEYISLLQKFTEALKHTEENDFYNLLVQSLTELDNKKRDYFKASDECNKFESKMAFELHTSLINQLKENIKEGDAYILKQGKVDVTIVIKSIMAKTYKVEFDGYDVKRIKHDELLENIIKYAPDRTKKMAESLVDASLYKKA